MNHKRSNTLGDILPQSTTSYGCSTRRDYNYPTLKMMGVDWVFLEETSKTINMKYNRMKSKPSLWLPSTSTNANSKQYQYIQPRYLNAKQMTQSNYNTEVRSSRSTFNQTNRSPINLSEGISTTCITTPIPNIDQSCSNSIMSPIKQQLLSSTTKSGYYFQQKNEQMTKELKKRNRTDPCRINSTFDEIGDIKEQEEYDQIWSSIVENSCSGIENPVIEEKVNNLLKEIEEEDQMKNEEKLILQKYLKQHEKREQSDDQFSKQIITANQEFSKLQQIIQKDKSFKNAYQNKYKFYQNCFQLKLQNQEAANQDMNENQRFHSIVQQSPIPLQAIYNKEINQQKDLKQIYLKYEKEPIEIKVPSSQVVKKLVDQRCRRKNRTLSIQDNKNLKDQSTKNKEYNENDQQLTEMYKDYIHEKVIQGYVVSNELKNNLNQITTNELLNNNYNYNLQTQNDFHNRNKQSNKKQISFNNQNQSNSNEYKKEISTSKIRSKSVLDQKRNTKIDAMKLPNLNENKINRPYINSALIDCYTPNIQAKSVKSKLYDSYYITPQKRNKLYQLKLDSINLIKDTQRNFLEEQMLFNYK
ncbi:hypothetical protein TTHERM_00858040 (macronuclear) [Tetrahymena thermophila SB210]|uniref:Uncharacterized protein n=1 Tax=Tetrahymena thermophila (strain SB210) TaxID=312017 RepID=Q23YV4_TETTS|nr:hypothetical protein TTHERM_00858040 [Tetrahymena thermophila SB210]EAS01701.1 hypothetical protein TTHERM_00858040 [Tetrahymena thermophila SB210]|eukprot:XP_001021946.1 hypothetical protein TTHERM_00858040 [Tetrahymena thermophila SB210]